jgi:phosphoglycolate phosphatase-like HAD superfamily hydrolase
VKTVFLFDVDGVLVHPRGYKEALRDTINYFATRMSIPPLDIRDDIIAEFEALGVTNEWDSAPFGVAAMLMAVLTLRPEASRDTIYETLDAVATSKIRIDSPRLELLMAEAISHGSISRPSHAFRDYFLSKSNDIGHHLYDELLHDVYDMKTPTTAVFQAHTIGYTRFEQTYGYAPVLSRESYLLTHDTALLSDDARQRLLSWSETADHGLSIFTARPSLPPGDSDADQIGFPPEGDLAAQLVQLERFPILGSGRLHWLGHQRGRANGADYIKPSPVHALAAIGAGLSGKETESLLAAVTLVENEQLIEPLDQLIGDTLKVVVFEDSRGGIEANRTAVQLLKKQGIQATLIAVGVSPESSKKRALQQAGAQYVVDDINQGLEAIW